MKPAISLLLGILVFFNLSAQQAADFFVTHYTNENGLPQNSVRGMALDKNGFLWIATEAGLVRFDGQRFRLYDKEHYPFLQSNRMTDVALDDNGIVIFSDEFGKNYDFDSQGLPKFLPSSDIKRRFIRPRYDFFWIRADSVFYWHNDHLKWHLSVPGLRYEASPNRWGTLNRKLYYRDKEGLLWVIDTEGRITRPVIRGLPAPLGINLKVNGLYLQDKALYFHAGKRFYRLSEDNNKELRATPVLETGVQNIRFYRNYPELNLQVIGTQTDGMYLFRRKQFTTLKHSNGFGNYYPQVPLGDSGVLTDKGTVYPSSSRFNYPFHNLFTFRSLLLDSRGHYWISEGSYGSYSIIQLDQQLRVLKRYPSTGTANCIRETPDGRIWLCAYAGRYLGYVDRDSVRWLPFRWQNPKSIQTFLPVDNETFWIAGVRVFARFNVKTGQQIHYPELEKYTVETLYLDPDKVLWIGTSGNGFFALKQNRLIKMPLDYNTGLKDVHSFMEDKNGFMWMSTNNGLFRCQKKNLDNYIAGNVSGIYYQCFKRESGFNTNEFNGSCTPSAIVLGNGKFSFSSADGLVQFYPDSIREVLPVNKIFIDKLLVDGKQQFTGHATVSLEPSFKYLEVQVASPYFGNAANQLLEYRLNGLDSVWHSLKDGNTVVFNNPGYGHYDLQFRKRSGFGYEHTITTNIPLFVKPFFYQTVYFKLIVLLAVALLIFLILKIRYFYLVKRNKELELEVSQRTFGLQQANKLKEKMLMMVGHDLQSPLYFLGYLSQTNYDSLQRDDKDKAKEMSLAIKNTSGKIYAFVEEFHLWARIQDEQYSLRKEVFALQPLLTGLADFFRELLQQYNNTMQLDIDRDYQLYTNRDLLKAILRNLVDNANKHTRNGIISITCTQDKGMGKITVSDTGNGIPAAVLDNIRQLIAKNTGQIIREQNERLGFQFIIDFTTRLEAQLSIESELGKGTLVHIAGLAIHTVEEQVLQSV